MWRLNCALDVGSRDRMLGARAFGGDRLGVGGVWSVVVWISARKSDADGSRSGEKGSQSQPCPFGRGVSDKFRRRRCMASAFLVAEAASLWGSGVEAFSSLVAILGEVSVVL